MKSGETANLKSNCSYATNFSKAMILQANVFVRILVPLCLGIATLHYCQLTKYNLLLYILLFSAFFLLFIINYLYRSYKVYHHKKKVASVLYFIFFLLGAMSVLTDPDLLDSDHFSTEKADYLKIYVADEAKETAGIIRFIARVISRGRQGKMGRSSGLLMVSLYADSNILSDISYGKVYLIPARFAPVPEPLNPGEFDSKSWMANQHIYHQSFLSATELIPLPGRRGSPIISYAITLRKKQVDLYRRLIADDEAFSVAATLILGYRADLNPETMAAYSKTGTIHALSVSGIHVAMIYLILEYALGWMNRQSALKWIKVMIILTLIWFYTLVSGCSASVLRSAIMLTMLILSKSLYKNAGGYHILALSAFSLLFIDPKLLWDAGFQLSYLAVTGLIYLQPRIYMLISFRYWPLHQAWSIVSVSLAAQLFTWPLSIYYFHQFPVYFLLSNLFIALPVAVLMYAGLIILLFRLYWLAKPFEWLITFMNNGLTQIAALPYSTVGQIWMTKAELAIFSAALLLILAGLCDKKKYPLLAGLFLLVLFQGMRLNDRVAAQRQIVMILYSLNRNYAVAFIRSDTAVLLTDLTPEDKVFQYRVQPALDQRRINNIICLPWSVIYSEGIQQEQLQKNNHQQLKNSQLNNHQQKTKNSNINSHQQHLKDLQISDHQLQFRNFKVLLADSFLNHKKAMGMPAFDAIWIHGNPAMNISELRKHVAFNKIWIDATNKNSLINKFQKDKLNFKRSTIVFKQNKASLVNLK
jgi:competence protein ComEC